MIKINDIKQHELKVTFEELRKAITDIQIQLDWINTTIDDIENVYEVLE